MTLGTSSCGAGVALVGLLLLADTSRAQSQRLEGISAGHPEAPKAAVVKMTLRPAVPPVPALKYLLLPEVRALKPGNAALLYQRAHSGEWWINYWKSGHGEKMGELLELPLHKMPRDKVVLLAHALKEIDRAARREYCDWEMTPRIREEGFMMLIPDVQGFRTYGQMLALRARLEMLDGRPDEAVATLQTGFALARHVGEAPILINALVGLAIGQQMAARVEEFVQLDKAPNLYWALADLPRPFIDMRRAAQGEKVAVDGLFPEIRAALDHRDAPPITTHHIEKYLQSMRILDSSIANNRFLLTVVAARTYPAAKKFLAARGYSAEQIEAVPVIQAALMFNLAAYDQVFDDMYKWCSFPYWEARIGLKKSHDSLVQLRHDQPDGSMLATLLIPAMNKVLFAKARLDRRLALLQVVEALRFHAAREGKLPERLEDIRLVPVPIDPVIGKAFEYRLEPAGAVLHGPPPPGEAGSEHNAVRFEVTLSVPEKK